MLFVLDKFFAHSCFVSVSSRKDLIFLSSC